jgi:transposase
MPYQMKNASHYYISNRVVWKSYYNRFSIIIQLRCSGNLYDNLKEASMDKSVSISDKQFLAKVLFTREHLEQKVVAKKVGVSEKTMSKWVNEFNWKALKNRLLLSKEDQINILYEELEEISNKIKTKAPGERFADTKQADIRIKTTAAIRNLETDLGIAELVDSGIQFIKFLQKFAALEQVLEITDLWHSFIQASIKK